MHDMLRKLPPSAKRVQDALKAAGVACEVVEMPSLTRTAQEAADAIGCTVAQIAKSLIFRTKQTLRLILIIASGVNRVDEKKVGQIVGEILEKPDAEYVKQKTGFTIGGIPPVGHSELLTTYLDKDLMKHDVIWAAAGTPFAVFKLTPTELVRLAPDARQVDIH